MKPVRFIQKDEILLAGFHAGPDNPELWRRFEEHEEKVRLTNAAGDIGVELRVYRPEGESVFTGLQVRSRDIAPGYELLPVPPALYAAFDIDFRQEPGPQFSGIDRWLEENRAAYTPFLWDGSEYVLCWYGRLEKETVLEVWVPVKRI